MKKLFTFFAAVLLMTTVWAQSPEKMSYQAVIRDASDILVTNQAVGMQVSILQDSANGTAVYVETQTPTTNANGLVSVEIGTGTTSDDFTIINWANGPYFIKTETDPTGGVSYTITSTSQLLSVPYALHAKTAETVTGGITETDPTFTSSDAANITATDITNLGNLSGTNTGDQDLSRITINEQAIQDTASQIRSDIPDVSGFLISETDPTFTSSEAANITTSDITNLSNLLGTNTGDQDLSTLASKTALGDSTAHLRSEIPDVSAITTNTQAIKDTAAQIRADIPDVPSGTQPGDMQYWNGTAWVTVEAGNEGQVLTFSVGVPKWKTQFENIQNPTTGKIWMDRNLGAPQVAKSRTDALAYGDLYQWGRGADGHEKRNSSTISTLSNSDTPGHGNFITTSSQPNDWRNPQNDALWQGVNGINNPCPSGYRLPTEAEWEAERQSWSSNDMYGAFTSLKLPTAGYRKYEDGLLQHVGTNGYYWSSTILYHFSLRMFFGSDAGFYLGDAGYRAYGFSVRCLKD